MPMQGIWEYKTILCPALDSLEISRAVINEMAKQGPGLGAAVVNWGTKIDRELNTLGSQGWELVTVWKSQLGEQGMCEWMTFKRQAG